MDPAKAEAVISNGMDRAGGEGMYVTMFVCSLLSLTNGRAEPIMRYRLRHGAGV